MKSPSSLLSVRTFRGCRVEQSYSDPLTTACCASTTRPLTRAFCAESGTAKNKAVKTAQNGKWNDALCLLLMIVR